MAIQKFTTPKGALEWVTISGEGKENLSGKLQYVANLVVQPEDLEAVQATIMEFWEANKPKGFKRKPKSTGMYLRDFERDDKGDFVLNDEGDKIPTKDSATYLAFKTGTTFRDGKHKVVTVYNAKNNKVQLGETQIGNGSVGRISGAMGIYMNEKNGKVIDAGVTLYLDAVQVLKLEEYSEEAGFEQEDGWTGEESGFEEPANTSSATPRL